MTEHDDKSGVYLPKKFGWSAVALFVAQLCAIIMYGADGKAAITALQKSDGEQNVRITKLEQDRELIVRIDERVKSILELTKAQANPASR